MTKSIAQKINELYDYYLMHEVGWWCADFIPDMRDKLMANDGNTTTFSSKQVDKIDELHAEYCGGLGKSGRPL